MTKIWMGKKTTHTTQLRADNNNNKICWFLDVSLKLTHTDTYTHMPFSLTAGLTVCVHSLALWVFHHGNRYKKKRFIYAEISVDFVSELVLLSIYSIFGEFLLEFHGFPFSFP